MPMDRHKLMKVMFGAHTNQYDVHRVGFDPDTLAIYLQQAGFRECTQVMEFGLFDDCSRMQILGTPISVNMIATKPKISDRSSSSQSVATSQRKNRILI